MQGVRHVAEQHQGRTVLFLCNLQGQRITGALAHMQQGTGTLAAVVLQFRQKFLIRQRQHAIGLVFRVCPYQRHAMAAAVRGQWQQCQWTLGSKTFIGNATMRLRQGHVGNDRALTVTVLIEVDAELLGEAGAATFCQHHQ